jgi:hypothetical protein
MGIIETTKRIEETSTTRNALFPWYWHDITVPDELSKRGPSGSENIDTNANAWSLSANLAWK